MLKEKFSPLRQLNKRKIKSGLVIVGGGMSGCCCAIAAARAGVQVVLVHDRPVLGGNASSEVRLWIQGATAHMRSNNRWAREGGVIDEILVENLYRNPDGNSIIFDTIVLEKVTAESNITLLLNTTVYELSKKDDRNIDSVSALCGQNSTIYELEASFFCDATGDGAVAFLSGASFRMGAEDKVEFGESLAPDASHGELPGHSIYFYTRDAGKPIKFTPPAYALKDIDKLPQFKSYDLHVQGCRLWWIEYGGRLDTVRDSETIKWELWKIVYGVWNHVKNSGKFPEASNLTLDWVGAIPNKKESRRFEGLYILKEQDIFEQRFFDDAVSYGGWPIDLHPADGIFSQASHYRQVHTPGLYQIPLRCMISKDIENLFLAGRIISATHVAASSLKVMGTCAQNAQAIGIAASICIKQNMLPTDLTSGKPLQLLQKEMVKTGQYIPGLQLSDTLDLNSDCDIEASSRLVLATMPDDGPWLSLETALAQMLPLDAGNVPKMDFHIKVDADTQLEVQLKVSKKRLNHSPDTNLETQTIELSKGDQKLSINFMSTIEKPGYAYICFSKNGHVKIKGSLTRITGILSLRKRAESLARNAEGKNISVWSPERRPIGHNLAFKLDPGLDIFSPGELRNGITRPAIMPNAWIADPADPAPQLNLLWQKPQTIRKIRLLFDADFDNPLESILTSHTENVSPFCIRNYRIFDENSRLVYQKKGNYNTRNILNFLDKPLVTQKLVFQFEHPSEHIPAALFEIRCYEN